MIDLAVPSRDFFQAGLEDAERRLLFFPLGSLMWIISNVGII